jgi:hypothetical protein
LIRLATQTGRHARDPDTSGRKEHSMLDLIVLAVVLGFFALSVGYMIACDRL